MHSVQTAGKRTPTSEHQALNCLFNYHWKLSGGSRKERMFDTCCSDTSLGSYLSRCVSRMIGIMCVRLALVLRLLTVVYALSSTHCLYFSQHTLVLASLFSRILSASSCAKCFARRHPTYITGCIHRSAATERHPMNYARIKRQASNGFLMNFQ